MRNERFRPFFPVLFSSACSTAAGTSWRSAGCLGAFALLVTHALLGCSSGDDSSDAPPPSPTAAVGAPAPNATEGGVEGSSDSAQGGGLSTITAVAVGAVACALRASGEVDCWGVNAQGALGIGDAGVDTVNPPAKVVGLTDAVQIAASNALGTTCARRRRGQVVCWGMNSDELLGDGQDASAQRYAPSPVPVAGLDDAVHIAVGGIEACAVRADGSVACWGAAVTLGTDAGAPLAPMTVAGVSDAVEVTVGLEHACARATNGTVACWGLDDVGQAGEPPDGNYSTRVTAPETVPGVRDAVEMASGLDHTCVRTSRGAVWCWGDNLWSQLGTGGAWSSTPTQVPGLAGAVEITAGDSFNCARAGDGTVSCWGANNRGQLGAGEDPSLAGSSAIPLPVAGVRDATAIGAGQSVACAVTSASGMVCWGDDLSGVLGGSTSSATPVPARGLTDAYAISAGWGFSCALVNYGDALCWGSNVEGKLGASITNTQLDSVASTRTTPVPVVGLKNAAAITAGESFACAALGGSGTVSCWGSNEWGELGNGTTSTNPTTIAQAVPGLANIAEISAGRNTACARTQQGAVYCWGLGFAPTPQVIAGLSALQITTGEYAACALLARPGGVVCWGDNPDGELGDGSTTYSTVPVSVLNITDAIQVGVGHRHACAVRSGGQVMCWGSNASGQLGIGQIDGIVHSVPAPVANLSDAVEVHGSMDSECARRGTGEVVCWGGGQGAPGAPLPSLVAQTFAVGYEHVCAISQNRSVLCWGDDSYGELGDGALLYSDTPMNVAGL